MQGGTAGVDEILAALACAGARRATTTITAIARAFDVLAARRIVLVTPYSAATTEHEAEFLRAAGYDVLSAQGFALDGSDAYCAAPPSFWRDRVLAAQRADADVYLVSCANISGFGVIAELEGRLARPVVTSNQAVIWDALRLVGWREPCDGPWPSRSRQHSPDRPNACGSFRPRCASGGRSRACCSSACCSVVPRRQTRKPTSPRSTRASSCA